MKNKVYALGTKDQMIMFLTGSTWADKTTAFKLAQRCCFEFCRAVSMLWNNRTFLFTAYIGSAVSCFGGIIICTTAFLNKKSNIRSKGNWRMERCSNTYHWWNLLHEKVRYSQSWCALNPFHTYEVPLYLAMADIFRQCPPTAPDAIADKIGHSRSQAPSGGSIRPLTSP